MSNRNLQNKKGEILSAEDEKLGLLLGSLKRVDAPNDFNFRVKARIAKGKFVEARPRLLPALRYVLPLSLAVFVAAFLALNSFYFVDNQSVPTVAENFSPAPVQNQSLPDKPVLSAPPQTNAVNRIEPEKNTVAETSIPVKIETKKANENKLTYAAVKAEKNPKELSPLPTEDEIGGGSILSSSGKPKVITPETANNANKSIENNPIAANNKSLTVEEIISPLGIETVLENGLRKVKSVAVKSLGDSSGIKVGDVIEAIDGEKISVAPLNSRSIEVKTLTIIRGTEKIQISLHN